MIGRAAVIPEVPAEARRLTVPFDRLPRWLDGFADKHGGLTTEAGEEQVLVTAADGSRVWIEVPFGPWQVPTSRPLTGLQLHLNRDRRIGVLLVRRGGYAAGVFDGSALISSKVGSAYVQGTTKAGGSSQQRFARRRANQARAAFAEAAEVAARILLPYRDSLQALICGGDRAAVAASLADPRLAPLLPLRSEPFLPVPDPRLRVLQATPEQFRSVRLAIHP
ncbi:MAG TPA: acVLRF1 family peptidyl-tRNA hydrolase [Jatrophihabitans sp.]|nr:acVLRF1 family peptidyl-tRNA hydrolase [Jatrophihabitans sp.]